jgi:hypothetical protein
MAGSLGESQTERTISIASRLSSASKLFFLSREYLYDDDDVYLDKLQTRGVEKSIQYM